MQNVHGGTVYNIAREMGIKPEQLLDFSANINPLGFSPRIRKVLFKHDKSILHYPDREAHDLIHELSCYHNISAHSILAGNGSTELIFLLPRVLKPRKALLVVPTFSEYETSVRRAGGRVFYFRTSEYDQFCINPQRLLQELKKGYDVVYICNPGNPTGVLTEKKVLMDIVSFTSKKSVKTIIDETFIDFNENESLKYIAEQADNVFVLRSMTKFFALPGLRAGYLISNKKNIERLREQQEPWTMNVIAQKSSIESLRDAHYIRKTVCYVEEARKLLLEGLKRNPFLKIYPGSANYLLVKLEESAPVTVQELYELLLRGKIIIRRCDSFAGLGKKYFRVAVRKHSENKRLIRELNKILK